LDSTRVASGLLLRGRSLTFPARGPVLSSSALGQLIARLGAAAPLAALLGVALAARLYSQPGISLYPDSYEFLLAARRLNPLADVAATMGANGDLWSIPFHRVGLTLIAAPISTFPNGVSALAFAAGLLQGPVLYLLLSRFTNSRLASFLVALVVATSFSAVAWSRLPMSESTALLLAIVSILLLLLAIERGHPLKAAAAAAAFALLLTTRVELILLLPGLLILPWSLGKPGAFPRVFQLLAGSCLLWLATAALLTVALADNMRELNGGLWAVLQANVLDPARAESGFSSGLTTFASREVPLLGLAGLGAAMSIAGRDRRGLAAALLIALPLALYATRDDFRYYLYLVPGLSLMAAIGLERLPSATAQSKPSAFSLPRLALPGVIAVLLVSGAVWQAPRLSEAWHPETAYEEEAARAVSLVLSQTGIADDAVICAPRAEAYYLETGRSVRHLLPDSPDSCFEGLPAGRDVIIVEDAVVQASWRDGLPHAIEARNPRLIATVPSPGLLIVGEEHYLAVNPIRVFHLSSP